MGHYNMFWMIQVFFVVFNINQNQTGFNLCFKTENHTKSIARENQTKLFVFQLFWFNWFLFHTYSLKSDETRGDGVGSPSLAKQSCAMMQGKGIKHGVVKITGCYT